MGVRVRKHHTGKWGCFITRQGRRRAIIRWETKKEAEAAARKLRDRLADLDLGLESDGEGAVALDAYARRWFNLYEREWKRTTRRNYSKCLDYIIEFFGSRDLKSIRLRDVKEFDRHLANGERGLKRRKNILAVLRGVFAEAVAEEIIDENPTVGVHDRRRSRKERVRPVYRLLNSNQLARLFEVTREHEPSWLGPFQCAGLAGLRSGEIRGLQWGDIAFGASETDPNRYLHIQRGITERGNIEESTKSGLDRKVDLSAALRQTLLAHQMSEFVKGRGKPDDWCFYRPDGRFLAERTMQKSFKRMLTLAGLEDIRFHDLRHSFATIHLRELRSPIVWLSAQLGHSSIKLTVDLYGHPEVETDVAVADRLGQAMTLSPQPSDTLPERAPVRKSATYLQPEKEKDLQPIEVTSP
ncbi:MAG: tyrosine-type recombinase/integrase [bacterium]|nr:tyrosine-type recombinase/integrase [bacterium]